MTNYVTRTVQAAELSGLSTPDRLDLIGERVRIDIQDEAGTGAIFGRLTLLTFVDNGVLIGLEGAESAIPVSQEELDSVTFTFFDWTLD